MEERSALEGRHRFFPGKSCAAPSGLWFDLNPFPGLRPGLCALFLVLFVISVFHSVAFFAFLYYSSSLNEKPT
jgi:hypothetical protein